MAATTSGLLQNAINEISALTKKPEDFLTVQENAANQFSKSLKSLYDTLKQDETPVKGCIALPELILDSFDSEQIWQELELQNNFTVSHLVSNVAKLCVQPAGVTFKPQTNLLNKSILKVTDPEVKKTKHKGRKDNGVGSVEDLDEQEENLLGSDEELEKIKSKLKALEKTDDKFCDFTGDSDDDLNFDFAPVGLNEDDEDLSGDEDQNTGKTKNAKTDSSGKKKKFKGKGSVVDDAFFKLSEMEEFLEQEDSKEERRIRHEKTGKVSDTEEDEEGIDMFADIESDDEDEKLQYSKFFDPPDDGTEKLTSSQEKSKQDEDEEEEEEGEEEKAEEEEEKEEEEGNDNKEETEEAVAARQKRRRDLLADSESEGEDLQDIIGGRNRETKSSFEQRQVKLKNRITQLEADNLKQKPWQLAGEISSTKRPENSLLSENLQFEHNVRLAPEITEETTKTLEDLIRQRIRDKAWDDVERKVKTAENPFEFKKRVTLEQEKSKQSLGEIYEQEYLKQAKEEEEEKTDPDHEEIQKTMTKLFLKLDALSNFHYTPKPAVPEVKIISNMPTIQMEEVAPVSVSDGKLLAPQEIQEKPIVEVKGDTEKTKTDKDRERKKKKLVKRSKESERKKREKLIEKLNPGLGNKYSKEKAMKQLEKESKKVKSGISIIKDTKEKSGLTSSKNFFNQLQDEVTTQIKSKKAEKRKDMSAKASSSKKYKL